MTKLHKWTYGIIISILIILVALLAYYYFSDRNQKADQEITMTDSTTDTEFPKPSDEFLGEIMYDYRGELLNVAPGSIRQTKFAGNASGFAQSGFFNKNYALTVTFENLPEPQNGDFYEGWIIRKNPLDVISTGKLTIENGEYVNRFESPTDLRDHTQYLLTIEPDDDNPAPDAHILEGTMNKVIE